MALLFLDTLAFVTHKSKLAHAHVGSTAFGQVTVMVELIWFVTCFFKLFAPAKSCRFILAALQIRAAVAIRHAGGVLMTQVSVTTAATFRAFIR